MSRDYPKMAKELMAAIGVMREGIPDVMSAFFALARVATVSGALDTKTKELIMLAARRDGCVAFRAKATQKAGATRAEALGAFDQFEAAA